jgi:S-adenosylmethionine-diacylglycerol 3-amino-3-carboxypropyl transferase
MPDYFKKLNYTLGDEDPSFEMSVLPERVNHVMAVADCGSRIVPLLAKQPQKLTCVDICSDQLSVTKLRIALLAECDLVEYRQFLGYEEGMSSIEREEIFEILNIDSPAKNALREMFSEVKWDAPLYHGKFERTLNVLSKLIRMICGSGVANIFDCKTIEEQRAYYRSRFPHFRWRIALFFLGNSTALNSLLYKGDFPKKNINASYFEVYSEIFKRLFTHELARNSFFLQLLILGRIFYKEGLPIECEAEVFSAAKSALEHCEVTYSENDVFEEVRKTDGLSFLSLSDVPSFLPNDIANDSLQIVKPHMSSGSLVVIRGHVRIVKPNSNGFKNISANFAPMAMRESTQLWTIDTYQTA